MLPLKFTDKVPSYDAAEVFYVRIDPAISTSTELFNAFYYLFWFPGYFGFNWDALYDCLRDLSWIPYRKVVIVHEGIPNIPKNELVIYLELLCDVALDWKGSEDRELEIFFVGVDRLLIEAIIDK
jgi:RNAse (barnase) inhibitor barstar